MEGAALSGGITPQRIEIKLSDDYRRAKRNHLFASGAVVLLAFAVTSVVNVPGFPDTKLPAATGLLLAWLAAVFFADEFRTEYSLARVRNSEINAGSTAVEIDRAFAARLEAIDAVSKWLTDVAGRIEDFGKKIRIEELTELIVDMRRRNKQIDLLTLKLHESAQRIVSVDTTPTTSLFDAGTKVRELLVPLQTIE